MDRLEVGASGFRSIPAAGPYALSPRRLPKHAAAQELSIEAALEVRLALGRGVLRACRALDVEATVSRFASASSIPPAPCATGRLAFPLAHAGGRASRGSPRPHQG